MNKNLLVGISIILGITLFIVSIVYFIEPAKSLPSFMPGYDVNLTKHHYTHAGGTFILSLLCFAFSWFKSGKKSTTEKK